MLTEEVEMNKKFNCRLSQAKTISKNAFGLLYQKFRVYNQKLQSDPSNGDRITPITYNLQNFIRKCGGNYEQGSGSDSEISNLISAVPRRGDNPADNSLQIRDKFKIFLFI
jgi:hypothetical protein